MTNEGAKFGQLRLSLPEFERNRPIRPEIDQCRPTKFVGIASNMVKVTPNLRTSNPTRPTSNKSAESGPEFD